ncbi:pantoate--beta-alanine ligase [Sediminitomix flava]|uniref:Pantothenate synthetase n=1 Tax=Sediminitomix flava TaxID=379075 RepID=A0A315Z9G3_SEDFL|nr:pantoate--beta-alanine ligase [Sediminitomix flava]PWJ42050.1 pantothenate synthetase [Sediminitomix flava]
MHIFKETTSLRNFLITEQNSSKTVGFVPTMGALHDGHLALIKKSTAENDITICSIYVNPTQFNNSDDLDKYPRTIDKDINLLENVGCTAVFLPDDTIMYPEGKNKEDLIEFNFGSIETVMEGAKRPGHFNGVGIVVSKLFHIVQPTKAYFGLKDLQQFLIIRKLTNALSFPIDVIGHPTERAEDGLALSSRNMRLSESQREIAPILYKALQETKNILESSEDVEKAIEKGTQLIDETNQFQIEYLEITDTKSLKKLDSYSKGQNYAICVAAWLGNVRLIDNILIEN